jgi:hypothetical protein
MFRLTIAGCGAIWSKWDVANSFATHRHAGDWRKSRHTRDRRNADDFAAMHSSALRLILALPLSLGLLPLLSDVASGGITASLADH